MTINLEESAWRQVLAILARAPWNEANALIMSIGEQMRQQLAPAAAPPPLAPDVQPPVRKRGNSGAPEADG